jgi:hypothetical protein
MRLEMLEGLFGLIVLALAIYAIVKTWGSSASTAAKAVWTIVLIFLPVIGFIAWLLVGPKDSPTYA